MKPSLLFESPISFLRWIKTPNKKPHGVFLKYSFFQMDIILDSNQQQFIHGILLAVQSISFQVYLSSNNFILISFAFSKFQKLVLKNLVILLQ